MLKKRIIRITAIALTLCLTLSLTAFAAPSQQSQGQHTNNGNGRAARYMQDQKIMRGDGNGNYNLSDYIKRGDLMIMLVRAFNLNSNAGGNHFNDVPSNSYYSDAIDAARENGIAKGDGHSFMPNSYVTIEHAIIFIERAMDKAGKDLSVDLRSLYDEDDLTNYATREDVAELLYYALTGDIDGFDGEYGSSNGWNNENQSKIMTISYLLDNDETATFYEDDFTDEFEDAVNEDLAYIKVTSLPSTSAGTLYYDYDEDDSSNTLIVKNKLYDVDNIDNITFVPVSDYSGTIIIPFTAYDENDESCTGKIRITVSDANAEEVADTFTITTDENEQLALDDSNFIDACDEATDEDLSYIKFTSLPSSLAGTLYLNYDEDDSTYTKIVKNTAYDVDVIDDITFVPSSGYYGKITISYTGYTEDDTLYTGTFKITVEEVEDVADTIHYYSDENEAVTFTLSKFKSVCSDLTDKTLSGVKFTLPDDSYGLLYYDYDEDDDAHTKVSSSKTYYVSTSPYLSKVTFVPEDGYTGTVEISYTGYTTFNTTFTGTIVIEIG